MAKILIGIVAAIALFCLAESLTCNQCSIQVFGVCLSPSTLTCTTNTSVCYTSTITFPSVSSFSGLNQRGCTESTNCANTNGTASTSSNSINAVIFTASYNIATTCCSTDNCNGANINSMSLTMALGVAALAALWGSHM